MQTTEQRLERLEKHNNRLTTALTVMVVAMCAVLTMAATHDKESVFDSVAALAGLPVLVHLRRDFLVCQKALWAHITQPAVRSFRVVMLSPIFNDDASFA